MVNPLAPEADTVAPRSVLFIGGTGVISAAAAERAVALGHRLTILNRGRQSGRPVPDRVRPAALEPRAVRRGLCPLPDQEDHVRAAPRRLG